MLEVAFPRGFENSKAFVFLVTINHMADHFKWAVTVMLRGTPRFIGAVLKLKEMEY